MQHPREFGVLEKSPFEGNNSASSKCTQQVAVPLFAREKLTLLAQKTQRAHRAIVRATNRPTGGKDARRLLATAISPIICAFKQLHGNPVVLPASVRTTDLIHPAGQSSDIIISVPSPEHRVDASRNVIIGLGALCSGRECVPSANFGAPRVGVLVFFEYQYTGSEFGKIKNLVKLFNLLSRNMLVARRYTSDKYQIYIDR